MYIGKHRVNFANDVQLQYAQNFLTDTCKYSETTKDLCEICQNISHHLLHQYQLAKILLSKIFPGTCKYLIDLFII